MHYCKHKYSVSCHKMITGYSNTKVTVHLNPIKISLFVLAASGSNDSNSGAIAGGVIASIAVLSIVCIILSLVLYLYHQRRKRTFVIKQQDDSQACMYLVTLYSSN